MIRLKKRINPKPENISTKNNLFNLEVSRLRAYFKLDPIEQARTRPPFNKEIVNTPTIIHELQQIQNNKCAYCETKLDDIYGKFISHYRPLSNASDPKNDIKHIVCYAWFAYEWQNLMLLCDDCNSHKLNYFPISGRTAQPFSSWRVAQIQEKPLLLNPFEEDPKNHLKFDTEGVAVGCSESGRITIELVNLNRTQLKINRKKAIENVLTLILNSSDDSGLAEALHKYTDDSSTHAGAIKNCLSQVCQILQNDHTHIRFSSRANLVQKIIKLKNKLNLQEWMSAIEACKANRLEFIIHNNTLDAFRLPKRYSYISRIEIVNFKGIKKFSLNFGSNEINNQASCTMLLGENATGKSSILQAIALTLMTSENRRRLPLDKQSIIPYSHDDAIKNASQLKVSVYFSNGETLSLMLNQQTGKFITIGEPQNLVFGYGSRRYFLSGKLTKGQPCPSKTLFNQAANLSDPTNWLLEIDDHKFNAVARALASLLTLSPGEFVSREEHSVFIQHGVTRVPIGNLSDGYKSLFVMSVDIMREMLNHWDNLEFAQGIVLVDEIENHLHPRWKMRVMSALRNSLPRVQFIASTHDPLCLRGMLEGEVKVLYRDRDGRLQNIENLPNVANLRIEQILTSDYFGLSTTEDPIRQHALETLAKYAAKEEHSLSPEDRIKRDELLARYGSLPIIGDTLDRQIIAQAVTRHLLDTNIVTPIERANAREASVQAIIEVLERNRIKYDTH